MSSRNLAQTRPHHQVTRYGPHAGLSHLIAEVPVLFTNIPLFDPPVDYFTMPRAHLPITALPVWAKLNGVDFLDINVRELDQHEPLVRRDDNENGKSSKGLGIVTERALGSKNISDIPTLLTIPRELVLCAETVAEFALVDPCLKDLLDIDGLGGKVS